MQNLKFIALVLVALFAFNIFFGDKSEQTADLGQVLDRTEWAINTYQSHMSENGYTEVTGDNMEEFRGLLVGVMNTDPRFYDKRLGMDIQDNATFLGYADENANGIQDSGEGDVFTVEIDEANQRLIATDVAGNSSGLRFSGSGFLAGALIGSLINRQRASGITASSFNNRSVTPRSSYRAPKSARSGGLRAGK